MAQVIDIKKYKNSTSISKVGDHNLRQQFSDNVDQEKSKQNIYLVGSADMNALDVVKSKLEGIKYRKDANKVCNLVFSASHEEMKKIDPVAWAKEINQYCEQKFGKENIVYSVLHRDELTPHLHISFVPVVDKKLRSNVYFDGPAKITKFRQEIFKINQKYGFKKDNPEKKAKAQSIAKHYQEVREFESLDKKIDKEFQQLEEIPKFSMNTKKVISEITPTFNNILKFARGLRVNFKKLGEKYKTVKKENLAQVDKIQQLERTVANYELKLDSLGVGTDISLNECIKLKPHVQESLTALAEKKATYVAPQKEIANVNKPQPLATPPKFKPR
jgi:Plasmid recombination enzyme